MCKKKYFFGKQKKTQNLQNFPQKNKNHHFFVKKSENVFKKSVKIFDFVFKNISFSGNHQLKPTNMD
jgi:hypothetical protein